MQKVEESLFLKGKFLIAMPGILDFRFTESVIYICDHNSEGAMGLSLNSFSKDMDFLGLINQLNLSPIDININFRVLCGGPVETTRGFVLHSLDYKNEDTIEINNQVGLTASFKIIEDIINKKGPKQLIFTLGYTGWGPGQLEEEIQSNVWLSSEADIKILFNKDPKSIRNQILEKLGISISSLSLESGKA